MRFRRRRCHTGQRQDRSGPPRGFGEKMGTIGRSLAVQGVVGGCTDEHVVHFLGLGRPRPRPTLRGPSPPRRILRGRQRGLHVLSRAWRGWPLRLSLDATGYGEAHVLITPDQVRELARELTAWADEDEQDGKATRSPGLRDPGDAAQAQADAGVPEARRGRRAPLPLRAGAPRWMS